MSRFRRAQSRDPECRVDVSSRLITALEKSARLDSRQVAVREALRLLYEYAEGRNQGVALHVVPVDGRTPYQVTQRHLVEETDLHKDRLRTELFVLVGTSLARHNRAKGLLGITSDPSVVEMGLALGRVLAEERSWGSGLFEVRGGRKAPYALYFGDKPMWLRARKIPLLGAPLSWILQQLSTT
jgi:hypothetical protein